MTSTVPEPPPPDDDHEGGPAPRHVLTRRASEIAIKPTHWLWDQRIALGTLALLGGREGIGKSTFAYQLVADLTRGRLPGAHEGVPRAAVVAATEDDWSRTIVPRLVAAGADLDLVYQVEVQTYAGFATGLSLPHDLRGVRQVFDQTGAALLLLDPLISRLDAGLDTHRDAEVRRALEPLARLAGEVGASILGIIHVSKAMTADPLTMLMGSRAFAAVARSVLFVAADPDDEGVRVVGTPKNNLGRTDLPTLAFRIEGTKVADTEEGPVHTGRLVWAGESTRTLGDVLEDASVGSESRTATQEAAEWLTDWLTAVGGVDESANIKRAGAKAGHSQDALKRARRRVGAIAESQGFPRRTYWSLPGTQPQSEQQSVGAALGESAPTALTAPTAPTESQSVQSVQSVQSDGSPDQMLPLGQETGR